MILLAVPALKYFQENAPEYHIAAAGSLLGFSVHQGTGFPVGKVDELTLYPVSFKEFLIANGKDQLVKWLENHNWMYETSMDSFFQEQLRQYYFTGDMIKTFPNISRHLN